MFFIEFKLPKNNDDLWKQDKKGGLFYDSRIFIFAI